jgi:hypothetical protein
LINVVQKVGARVAEVFGVKQENAWAAGKDNATR